MSWRDGGAALTRVGPCKLWLPGVQEVGHKGKQRSRAWAQVLVHLEAHWTHSGREHDYAVLVFVGQLLNSALVLLVVNAAPVADASRQSDQVRGSVWWVGVAAGWTPRRGRRQPRVGPRARTRFINDLQAPHQAPVSSSQLPRGAGRGGQRHASLGAQRSSARSDARKLAQSVVLQNEWTHYLVLNGQYHDFSPAWYREVGLSFLVLLMLQVLNPVLTLLADYAVKVAERCWVTRCTDSAAQVSGEANVRTRPPCRAQPPGTLRSRARVCARARRQPARSRPSTARSPGPSSRWPSAWPTPCSRSRSRSCSAPACRCSTSWRSASWW